MSALGYLYFCHTLALRSREDDSGSTAGILRVEELLVQKLRESGSSWSAASWEPLDNKVALDGPWQEVRPAVPSDAFGDVLIASPMPSNTKIGNSGMGRPRLSVGQRQ